MIMEEINQSCPFNVLHICDYHAGYANMDVFTDYPGDIVNCSLRLEGKKLDGREVEKMFNRPFMGGLDRKGFIATGNSDEIAEKITILLEDIPDHYILAADCTVPSDTPWDNLRSAIRTAHDYNS
jgi:uroporphyrinogen decarboxylase